MPSRKWRIVHSEASLGWGGQEHRVLAELVGFRQRGHAVALLAPPLAKLTERAAAIGIRCEPLLVRRLRFPFEAVRLARWLRSDRVDILNPHSSADGWLVGVAGRLARVPLVIRSRHIDVTYPNAWISRHAFSHLCDQVVTTSDKISEHLRARFSLPPDRVSTVATGIDLQKFHPSVGPADLLPSGGLPGAPLVGMISVLRSWKGHATFFAAARRLCEQGRQINFVVVGGGAPVAAFQTMAQAEGVGDCITFAGHREDVPAVLRALSVLVIPSTRHEGIPQIGLQALACQTPVVGSDCGGIPEVIRNGETGRIFPVGDSAALAATVAQALDRREETLAFAEAGRRQVEAKHSTDFMLDRLEEIYRRRLPN